MQPSVALWNPLRSSGFLSGVLVVNIGQMFPCMSSLLGEPWTLSPTAQSRANSSKTRHVVLHDRPWAQNLINTSVPDGSLQIRNSLQRVMYVMATPSIIGLM